MKVNWRVLGWIFVVLSLGEIKYVLSRIHSNVVDLRAEVHDVKMFQNQMSNELNRY